MGCLPPLPPLPAPSAGGWVGAGFGLLCFPHERRKGGGGVSGNFTPRFICHRERPSPEGCAGLSEAHLLFGLPTPLWDGGSRAAPGSGAWVPPGSVFDVSGGDSTPQRGQSLSPQISPNPRIYVVFLLAVTSLGDRV